jgi:hypothetical protein
MELPFSLICQLVLADKSLQPCEIVQLQNNPGRKGFCVNLRVKACVTPVRPCGYTSYLVDVEPSNFSHVLSYAKGDIVTLGAWVGTVLRVAPRIYADVDCSWDQAGYWRCSVLAKKIARNFLDVNLLGNEDVSIPNPYLILSHRSLNFSLWYQTLISN